MERKPEASTRFRPTGSGAGNRREAALVAPVVGPAVTTIPRVAVSVGVTCDGLVPGSPPPPRADPSRQRKLRCAGALARWAARSYRERRPRRTLISPAAGDVPLIGQPEYSIVIPTLDEEGRIASALSALLRMAPSPEIIVADGGSRDGTVRLARAFEPVGVRVLACPSAGRGPQMNAGAAEARGRTLVFLHADVTLPEDAFERMEETLRDPDVVAGAFRTRTIRDGPGGAFSTLLLLADLRSRYSSLPYGDQALFIRAEAFRSLGGYAEIPLMEDLELALRLRRAGKVALLRATVSVSGRRFQTRPVRSAISMNVFPVLFRMGVSPRLLARFYGHPR